jgi:trehalose 6-phosphate phosphatase
VDGEASTPALSGGCVGYAAGMVGLEVVEEAVARLRRSRPPRGFFFDFDGVLAPIREDPQTSAPDPDLLAELYRLANLTRRVSVVSARPISFLSRHIEPGRHVTLFGLYGLERRDVDGNPATDPEAMRWEPYVRELVARAGTELPAGIRVEDKRLSVALHYREAPHLRVAAEQWAGQAVAGTDLQLIAGRMVVELRPPGHDKGSVVAQEILQLRSAWYFGDDVSDLEAFRALDSRGRQDPGFDGVRVAVANPETGDPLQEAADLVVDSPGTLLAVLKALGDGLAGLGREA